MHYDINISIALDSWPWCVYLYLYDARVYDSYFHDLCIHEPWHYVCTYLLTTWIQTFMMHLYLWSRSLTHVRINVSPNSDALCTYVMWFMMHISSDHLDACMIQTCMKNKSMILILTLIHACMAYIVCMMHTYLWCSRLFTNRPTNKAILGVGCQHKKCPRHDDQCHLICWSCHWGGQMNMCIPTGHPTHPPAIVYIETYTPSFSPSSSVLMWFCPHSHLNSNDTLHF